MRTSGHFGQPGHGRAGRSGRGDAFATLTANSGIHFLDVTFAVSDLADHHCAFADDTDADGERLLIALPAATAETRERPDCRTHPLTGAPLTAAEVAEFSALQAMRHFRGQWLPLPFLRRLGQRNGTAPGADDGPQNWVRAYIGEARAVVPGTETLPLAIAIDTRLDATSRLEMATYAAPSRDDVLFASAFQLADDPVARDQFLSNAWVSDWVAETASAPEREAEAFALYLTILDFLSRRKALPSLRFSESGVARRGATTTTALVIDMADTNTVARLVEDGGTRASRPGRSAALRVRDLGIPTHVHTQPFPSLVHFESQSFGNHRASRASGRDDAFIWPTPVRVGAEAARLASAASALDGLTGLDRLDSALADTRPRGQSWRFANARKNRIAPGGVVADAVLAHLTDAGEVIANDNASAAPAVRPRFAPAAMAMLFTAELLAHALSQVHACIWDDGAASWGPLTRIIVACPANAGAAERAARLKATEDAVAFLWRAYGWDHGIAGDDTQPPDKPAVVLSVDRVLARELETLVANVGRAGSRAIDARLSGAPGIAGPALAGASGATRVRGPDHLMRVALLDCGRAAFRLSVVDYATDTSGAIVPLLAEGLDAAHGLDALADAIALDVVLPAIAATLPSLPGAHGTAPSAAALELTSGDGGRTLATASAWSIAQIPCEAGTYDPRGRWLVTEAARAFGLEPLPAAHLIHNVARPAARAVLKVLSAVPLGAAGAGTRRARLATLASASFDGAPSDGAPSGDVATAHRRAANVDQRIRELDNALSARNPAHAGLANVTVDIRPAALRILVRAFLNEATGDALTHLAACGPDRVVLSGAGSTLPDLTAEIRQRVPLLVGRIDTAVRAHGRPDGAGDEAAAEMIARLAHRPTLYAGHTPIHVGGLVDGRSARTTATGYGDRQLTRPSSGGVA